ncbi:MAG: hypothetical protein ACP5NQ_04970 [Vulcanisaeta sp.]
MLPLSIFSLVSTIIILTIALGDMNIDAKLNYWVSVIIPIISYLIYSTALVEAEYPTYPIIPMIARTLISPYFTIPTALFIAIILIAKYLI